MRGLPGKYVAWVFVFQLLVFAASCDTVPITGRTQLSLVSDSELHAASFDAYRDFKAKNKVSTAYRRFRIAGMRWIRARACWCAGWR